MTEAASSPLLTTWLGPEGIVTVPRPSWIAPPLLDTLGDASPVPQVRLSTNPPKNVSISVRPPSLPTPLAVVEHHAAPDYPDLRMEYAALQAQLIVAANALSQLRRKILEDAEPQVVRLACEVGKRIAGRELSIDPSVAVGWVQEALEELAGDPSLVVVVSADIAKNLHDAAWDPVKSATTKIEVDEGLPPSSCEVRGTGVRIDASFDARAAAVTRHVTGESQ